MRLVLTIPPHGKHVEAQWIPLREVGVDVGGASDCDAIVDHPSVGTARVRLERRGEDWVVIDREGRGACSVGGVPLRPREPRIVRPPHGLRLGDIELALAFDPLDSRDGATRDVALRAAAFVAEIAPHRPRIRVVEGPRIGETLDLAHAGPYRVGRGKSCDLFLDADDASREHFSIECQGDRVVVRDLGSPRGTFLGRSRLDPNRGAVWEPTRMLRAADTVFSLEVATPGSPHRLLEPLERVPDKAPPHAEPASELPVSPPASETPSDDPEAVDVATTTAAPASSPMTQPPSELPQEAPRKPSRDPTFFIVVLAVVLGIAGVAALFALFLW
jgi:FHA domain-containing protein